MFVNNGGILLIFSTDVYLEGSIFQKVGAVIEKALVPLFIFPLGTKRKAEINDRS